MANDRRMWEQWKDWRFEDKKTLTEQTEKKLADTEVKRREVANRRDDGSPGKPEKKKLTGREKADRVKRAADAERKRKKSILNI